MDGMHDIGLKTKQAMAKEEHKFTQFSFFENYYVAASMLPVRERQGKFLLAIAEYMFSGKEPDWQPDEQEGKLWKMVLPGLNSSIRRAKNGALAKDIPKPGMVGNKNAVKDAEPTKEAVMSFARQIGYSETGAERFFYYYDGHVWPKRWKSTLKSWKLEDDAKKDRLHISAHTPEDYEGEF